MDVYSTDVLSLEMGVIVQVVQLLLCKLHCSMYMYMYMYIYQHNVMQ